MTSPNFWFCVIHVMQKIKIWSPYLTFIQKFLDYLDVSLEDKIKTAEKWILNQENYPHLKDFRYRFNYGWETLIQCLYDDGKIILDDMQIVYTGVNKDQLEQLLKNSVPLKDLNL